MASERSPLLGADKGGYGVQQQLQDSLDKRMDRTCANTCESDHESERKMTPKELKSRNAIIACIVIAFFFMIAEFVGGYIANSVAIFSDALHMLSDIAGLLLSLVGIIMGARPPSQRFSYGFKRLEVVASMMSVLLIWFIAGILVYQAIIRLMDPPDVEGEIMLIVACFGILSNVIMAAVLHMGGAGHAHGGPGHNCGEDHGHAHGNATKDVEEAGDHGHSHAKTDHGHSHAKTDHGNSHAKTDHGHSHAKTNHGHSHGETNHGHPHGKAAPEGGIQSVSQETHAGNINVRSAMIHVIGDLLQNVGVVIAAGFIWWQPQRFKIIDPICTLVFAIATVLISLKVLRDGAEVLLDVTPRDVDVDALKRRLTMIPTVTNVHDVHCWYMAYGEKAFSCHVTVGADETGHVCAQAVLKQAEKISGRFGVTHTTIQIEEPAHGPDDHAKKASFCVNAQSPKKVGKYAPPNTHELGGNEGLDFFSQQKLLGPKARGQVEAL